MIPACRLAVLLLSLSSLQAASNPRVWFVDNGRADSGEGSRQSPFATIGEATRSAGPGDVIYVHRSARHYEEQVVLGEGQLLAGDGIDLADAWRSRAIDPPAGLPQEHVAPTLDGGDGDALTLNAGSVVAGLRVRSRSGRSVVASGLTGEVVVRDTRVETAAGTALAITGGDARIRMERSPISAGTGTAIAVRDSVGGFLRLLEGSTVTVTAGAADAIIIENSGGETSFGDVLDLRTVGGRGLFIRNATRVEIAAPASTIDVARAAGIVIEDSQVMMKLKSVSVDARGADVKRGISLKNVSGELLIGGGTIRKTGERAVSIERSSNVALANMVMEDNAPLTVTPPCSTLLGDAPLDCGASVFLSKASNISLSAVRIAGSGTTAILGDDVTNLTLDRVTIEGAGDESGEHSIAIRGLYGKNLISGATISGGASRQLYVVNRSGEGTLEIRSSRLSGAPPPAGQQGIAVEIEGAAKWTLVAEANEFTEHFSDALAVVASGTSRVEAFVYKNRFAGVGSAVSLIADEGAEIEYRVNANEIRGARGPAINVHTRTTAGGAKGLVAENVIGVAGIAGSGSTCGTCSGISVIASRGGHLEATIRDNIIRQVDGYGIRVNARGTAVVAASITGNRVSEPAGDAPVAAIQLQTGALKADVARLCAEVSGNTVEGAWPLAFAVRGATSLTLKDLPQAASHRDAVSSFLSTRNHGVKVSGSGVVASTPGCF
jgi:hypothetical protein